MRQFDPTLPIKYDLYFAGSSYESVMERGIDIGVCKLFTQIAERKDINYWAENKRNGRFKGKLLIDSGAYSAHTRGLSVNMDDYIQYINDLGDGIDYAIELDHIPGKFGVARTKEQAAESPKISWDNFLYMRDRINNPDKLLPVFHQDEDFKWLKNMVEYKDSSNKHLDYICISSSKDKSTKLREDWYYKCFSIIHASSNPDIKVHSLGTSSITHMEKFPFYSSDATSWIRVAALGCIYTDRGQFLVSDQTIQNSAGTNNILYDKQAKRWLEEYVNSFGITLEQVSKENSYRQLFNMLYYVDWAQHYEYKGPKVFKQRALFSI